jgi:DNA repair protein RadC
MESEHLADSDAALLARALGTRVGADRARGLLECAGGVDRMGCLDAGQVKRYLGKHAAERLCAWLEVERRGVALAAARAGTVMTESRHVAQWASRRLAHLPHEELWLLSLTRRSLLRASRLVARGGCASMSVASTEVLRAALAAGGPSYILVHNHPSGESTPSDEDERFTRHVARASRAIGLTLADHVIVSVCGYYSVGESNREWLGSAPADARDVGHRVIGDFMERGR